MLVETRIFSFVSAFILIMGVIYAALTGIYATGGIEWAGVTALFLAGALCATTGGYFWFVAKRLTAPRPEDDPEATIVDNPEEVGFFSPGSIWPITVSACVTIIGIGLSLCYFWLIGVGVVCLLGAVAGLVFEYYRAPEKH